MFREMRRKKQMLSNDEIVEVLERNTSGVLALIGDDNYPYSVPLSYVYSDGKILFHCAKQGHKIDAIMKSNKVSFCVIDKDDVVAEKFTTNFRSVIAFGKARIITDDNEKIFILRSLVDKYSNDFKLDGEEEIKRELNLVCIIEISIEYMTGKEAMEMAKVKLKK
ncbi:pyridoxamine 5'-phosphate oxidase family protein [Clostridium carnis]